MLNEQLPSSCFFCAYFYLFHENTILLKELTNPSPYILISYKTLLSYG